MIAPSPDQQPRRLRFLPVRTSGMVFGAARAGSGGARRIAFHRRVVLLSGVPGVWVAAVCLLTVAAVVAPAGGLALAAAVLLPGIAVLGMSRARLQRLRLPGSWTAWLIVAIHEEEAELAEAIRPRRGTWRDGIAALAALAVVVTASITMEQAASALGRR